MKNAGSAFKFRSSRRDIQTSMERVRWVLPTLVMATAIGVILFGTAGRLNLPFFWLYLVVWATGGLIAVVVVDSSL